MAIALYDLVGVIGTIVLIAVYFGNQQRWLSSEDWRFPAGNLVGALLILVSLFYDWNLPSVVIEFFWIAISLWGIGKSLAARRALR